MEDVKAGVALRDITPPVGVPLAGCLRARISEGVNDPLYTRALVLSDGNRHLVVVALDLIAICREDVEEARNLIYERTEIPRESILVCASHTHSAPYTSHQLRFGGIEPDASYMMKVREQIAEAVTDAYEKLEPAKIGFSSAKVTGLMQYSRLVDENGLVLNYWCVPPEKVEELKPAGPIDEELLFLAVKSLDNNHCAIVFNYPLHAQAYLRLSSSKISADYPGVVAGLVSERLGRDVITLFTSGACADIIPKQGNKEMMNKIGEAIASEIFSVLDDIEYVSKCRLGSLLKEVALPLRDFSRFQEQEVMRVYGTYKTSPTYSKYGLKVPIETFRKEYEYLSKLEEKEVRTVVHTLVVNEAAFISAPGELFCKLGLDIKSQSPYKRNFVTELADDYVGYIPNKKAFEQGGYETINARSAKVADGAGEKIVEEALDMLEILASDAE